MKQGIRYLEAQDFLLCDKTEAAVVKLEFTDAFFKYATKVSGNVEVEKIVGQKIDNLLSSAIFKSLSKRVAAKLFLLTLLAHSDEYGIVRNLSIKDLHELMGRFSKDRHRSQLNLLKKAGYIIEYSPGMSGGILLGKQKSEYLLNLGHRAVSGESSIQQASKEGGFDKTPVNESSKPKSEITQSSVIKASADDPLYAVIRLSNLVRDIQRKDILAANIQSKVDKLQQDLLPEELQLDESQITNYYRVIDAVGGAFEGEIRGFQIQRYVSKLALKYLSSSQWKVPSIEQVRNSLIFDELFSDKFLRTTILELIDQEKDGKLKPLPITEQPEHYKKLKSYMNDAMVQSVELQSSTPSLSQQIAAITWLVSLCVIYTAKTFKEILVNDEDGIPSQKNLVAFKKGEDISLYFF